MEAMTQRTSVTNSGPGWQSVMTGVEPLKHLVFTNARTTPNRYYNSFLWYARNEYDLKTMAAVNLEEKHTYAFLEDDSTDFFQNTHDMENKALGDEENIETIEYELGVNDYGITFLCIENVDAAGHRYFQTFDTQEYLDAIEIADGQIGRVLDAIDSRSSRHEEEWLVAITTDHGGQAGIFHGDFSEECRKIFLILSGDRVKKNEIPPDCDI